MELSVDQKFELAKNEKFMDVFRELSTQRFPDISSPAIFETMFATMEFAVDHVLEFVDFLNDDGDLMYIIWRLKNDFGLGAKFINE